MEEVQVEDNGLVRVVEWNGDFQKFEVSIKGLLQVRVQAILRVPVLYSERGSQLCTEP